MVELDGYWYRVDVTATYVPSICIRTVFDTYYEEHNSWLASQGYFSAHPYGTKYMEGCRIFTYNSIDELRLAYNNKSSELWQEYNQYGSVAIKVPNNDNDPMYLTTINSLLPGDAKYNSNEDASDLGDANTTTYVCYSRRVLSIDTTPLPALSNYLN